MHLFPISCLVSFCSLKLAVVGFSWQMLQIMSPLISEKLVVNHVPDSTGLCDSLFVHFPIGWYWGYFQFFAIRNNR